MWTPSVIVLGGLRNNQNFPGIHQHIGVSMQRRADAYGVADRMRAVTLGRVRECAVSACVIGACEERKSERDACTLVRLRLAAGTPHDRRAMWNDCPVVIQFAAPEIRGRRPSKGDGGGGRSVGIRLCTVATDVDVVGVLLLVVWAVGVADIVDISKVQEVEEELQILSQATALSWETMESVSMGKDCRAAHERAHAGHVTRSSSLRHTFTRLGRRGFITGLCRPAISRRPTPDPVRDYTPDLFYAGEVVWDSGAGGR
ncbi:hypothetical protein PR048_001382 [Dryococelus australis]|uniref:Uncharacterized protein n=1 Tax=Dryococelus australis TaxID=614101 RepID=A0ABQ9IHB3_9NEOP|nr:hypothetical protein PR048_001382 [Dryococelus australis]